MKNVTVSLDDAVYRKARMHAAEMGKSLSAIVKDYLNSLETHQNERERLRREEQELRSDPTNLTFSGAERLSRDELYDRSCDRPESGEWRNAVNG